MRKAGPQGVPGPLGLPCREGLWRTWVLEWGMEAAKQTLGQELDACLGQEKSSGLPRPKMVPREAPSSPDLLQETRLTSSVLLEGKVRKSQFCTLIPGLEQLPIVPGPARRPPCCQSRVTWSGKPFPSPIHPQLTHLPRPCLSLLGSARRTRSAPLPAAAEAGPRLPPGPRPAPSRRWPPRSAGPRTSACPWRSSWRRGFQVNTLSTSRARTISTHRQPRSWQVGGAPPGDEWAGPEGPDDCPSGLWAGPHRQEGPLLCRTHWP